MSESIPKKKVKQNYIDNAKFLEAIKVHKEKVKEAADSGKEKPRLSNYLGECILNIARHMAYRPEFIRYSYIDEMVEDAIENCFHGSVKVATVEYGPIEFSRIVGQTVTVRCRDGNWRPVKVKSYGRQKLYEIGFGTRNKRQENICQTVIVTSNHRWFLEARLNRKKMFDWNDSTVTDLKVGDMLESPPKAEIINDDAVIHGIVFGDGSVNRKVQGEQYAFMRVCKQDKVRDEIVRRFDNRGYRCTYPPSAKGDPVYYFDGPFPYVKEIPFTHDPDYIAGFIHGWWLADGSKTTAAGHCIISTVNEEAARWLVEHCAYAGYSLLSFRRKENRSAYPNGKPFFIITLGNIEYYKPRVKYIKEWGEDEVYCVEEPVTGGFVLANGLLTGNCLQYFDNFDPDHIGTRSGTVTPFGYFSQITYYAFTRRILKEQKYRYTKCKILENVFASVDGEVLEEYNPATNVKVTETTASFVERYEEREMKKKLKRDEKKRRDKDSDL